MGWGASDTTPGGERGRVVFILCVLHLKFIINKISFLQKDYMLILENLENLETRERKKTKFPSSP